MADYGGGGDIRQLYGVIIRDKAKTADKDTLHAYRIVASDLMHGAIEEAAKDLKAALADLENAIQAKW
jgi:hypothetical protein